MAEKATVARPYARAAFEYAQERREFESLSKLLALGSAVVADPSVEALLGNPRVPVTQLVDLIVGVAGNSGVAVDAGGRNFLGVLAQNRRLGFLPEIATQYEALRAEVENVVDVEVVTAIALSAAQREQLSAALAKRFGRQVRLAETVDESLVGGALVRAGDLVIDGSLQGRLGRLTQQMTAQ